MLDVEPAERGPGDLWLVVGWTGGLWGRSGGAITEEAEATAVELLSGERGSPSAVVLLE